VISASDPIRDLESFHRDFAKPHNVYLAGNSLGLMPLAAEAAVAKLIQEWKEHAIEGWTSCGWIDQAERLSLGLAPLLGAHPEEIAVTGSTTVNLHQLLATFYHPRSDKRKILIDGDAFPPIFGCEDAILAAI
jgi:kynureninase